VESLLPGRPRVTEKLIFLKIGLPFIAGYFVSYVYRMVNAVLAPTLAAEFGLSAGGLGLLSSMYFLSFAVCQLPVGVAMDRFGPRRVNAALLLVAAAGGAWFAHAETAAAAMAARALIGIGVSACLMASLTAFVLWYPPGRLSTMNAIAFSAGALGAMTTTVPLEILLRSWHWREAFMLIVGATVAASLLLWLWVPERSARPHNEGFREILKGLGALLREAVFLRLAVCLGASQFASVALQTLWIATWLRDVAGYTPAEVARGLLAVNASMIAGYLVFGRTADAFHRRGRNALPLLIGGVAVSSLCLVLLIAGMKTLLLWCVFVAGGTAVVLAYPILSLRYPKAMAGRANTAINVFGFIGMFSGQWGIGLVLDLWPPSATGYAAEAYAWALGMVWAVQLAGIAWLWSGRALLADRATDPTTRGA
jgi:predicted MFS family arabinose efflux permease